MLISREQAAVDLDVSFSTVVRWEQSGELVARKVGPRKTLIDTGASPAYVQKFASPSPSVTASASANGGASGMKLAVR